MVFVSMTTSLRTILNVEPYQVIATSMLTSAQVAHAPMVLPAEIRQSTRQCHFMRSSAHAQLDMPMECVNMTLWMSMRLSAM